MLQNLKVRVALIIGLAVLCVASLFYNQQRKGDMVTLGLDLKGGIYLALEIDDTRSALTREQRADAIDRALKVVRIRVDQLGLGERTVQKSGDDRIVVELPGLENTSSARDIVSKAAFLEFQIVRGQELAQALPRLDQAVAEVFPSSVRGAAAAPAAPGPFQQQGADSAAITARPFQARIARAGAEGQLLVAERDAEVMAAWLRNERVQAALPRGTELLWGVPEAEEVPGFRSLWLVDREPMMTGQNLTGAVAATDPQFGRPVVNFELNRRGGRTFV